MITAVGPWVIEHDPDATRRCYARIPWGDDCDCGGCRNLDALGLSAFPASVLDIFEQLGIDWHKPAEVYHCGRLEDGLHAYGGWYHCVGQIVSGGNARQPEPARSTLHRLEMSRFSEHFHIACSSMRQLAPKAFEDLVLVQLDFSAELPWVLDEPEWT